ncbi:hypothetical protein [Ascidiaceihabitans sp.]|uniref:hypothetical protein n=1 Tax=Ascidiaceihabitans sp. TaxID=1872644 RepID=UPI003296CF87
MIVKYSLGILAVAATLAACNKKEDAIAFDGQFFRAKLAKVDKQRDQFTVTIGPVSSSLDGAKEAGRYEATRYCIEQFGTSDKTWVIGPDSPNEQLRIEGDKLVLRGACVE